MFKKPVKENLNNELFSELKELKDLLLLNAKKALSMSDCALLTNLSKSCLYKFVSKNTIPYYKNGKRTYFDKDEINEWLLRNRVAPAYEIEQKATNYMVRNRKKRS